MTTVEGLHILYCYYLVLYTLLVHENILIKATKYSNLKYNSESQNLDQETDWSVSSLNHMS